MDEMYIGDTKIKMISNCHRVMISTQSRESIAAGKEANVFFWEPGDDPKWLKMLPRTNADKEDDKVIIWRIIWVIARCLNEDFSKLTSRMTDGLAAREDVREFFQFYLKWRQRAEDFSANWPWNLTVEEIDGYKEELEVINKLDSLTATESSLKDFLLGVIPDPQHPYYDADLRLNGSSEERKARVDSWRSTKRSETLKSLKGVGKGNPS